MFLDSGVANHDASIIKLLRNATEHSPSSQSGSPVAMEKITDALLRCPDDYFHVRFIILRFFFYNFKNVMGLINQAEALGLLANLGEFAQPEHWKGIITERRLLDWIDQRLKPGECYFLLFDSK